MWDRAQYQVAHNFIYKKKNIWVNNRLRQTNSTWNITGQKVRWLCSHTWALACLSWRILVTCLNRCFAFSLSIPPSWTWCWLSSFCAGCSARRCNFRSENRKAYHTCLWSKIVLLMVFVYKDFGGRGNEVFHYCCFTPYIITDFKWC